MELKEILQKMQEKLDAAKAAEDTAAKMALMDEFDALKARKELVEREQAAEKALVEQATAALPAQRADEGAVHAFAEAARRGFKQAYNEGTDAAGGYTVPEDISTRIEQLRTAKFSLESLVTTESVKTNTGARTFQTRATMSAWSSVSEGGKLPITATPTFDRYTYSIAKYGGVYVATNELLEDTDAAITANLTEWIADKSRATRNALVLAALDEKYDRTTDPETMVTISSVDDIKKVVNVTLGQAFAPTSVIVTNDSGFHWLDTQKDDNKNYLLKPENNDPLRKVLACGSLVIPVVVVPNAVLANDEDTSHNAVVPFYIGDLREAVRLFDRKQLTIKVSDVASAGSSTSAVNAFDEDLTLFRAVERLDCVCRDAAAYVKGKLTLAAG